MGALFPIGEPLLYFVEERLATNLNETFYAWTCNTKEEAERILLEQIRTNGHTRFYSVYAKFK